MKEKLVGRARRWCDEYCPSFDGQFLFLDPLSWDTHLLSEGAAHVLSEAAIAIDDSRFEAFVAEVKSVGGWPPGLEQLALSLAALHREQDRCRIPG